MKALMWLMWLLCLLLSPLARAQSESDRLADRLLNLLHCQDGQHEILRENLATYFFNLRQQVPESALTDLESFEAWLKQLEVQFRQQRTFGSNELGRWPSKFRRSLSKPYDDNQAGQKWRLILRTFRQQCRILAQARPGYARPYYVFGGIVHGRYGANSDLDFIFRDPEGTPASKQFIVRGISSGYAFDEASMAERQAKARDGQLKVVMGGPVAPLEGPRPWEQLDRLLMKQIKARGLLIKPTPKGWQVRRLSYPTRTYEDPSTDAEREQKI